MVGVGQQSKDPQKALLLTLTQFIHTHIFNPPIQFWGAVVVRKTLRTLKKTGDHANNFTDITPTSMLTLSGRSVRAIPVQYVELNNLIYLEILSRNDF